MIDIAKKAVKPAAKATEPPAKAVVSRRLGLQGILSLGFLAGSGGLGLWRHRRSVSEGLVSLLPDFTPEHGFPCLMWVLDPEKALSRSQGAASNSTIVSKWCVDNNVDYRRYRSDANMIQCSDHIRSLHRLGVEFGSPCLVVCDHNGRGRAYQIPEGTDATLDLLREVFHVA